MLKPIALFTMLLVAPADAGAPATQPVAPQTPAQRAFVQFKQLEGAWVGKSSKGWEEQSRYAVIAGGSVVMHNSFEAHPGQQMVTMFHMDGENLMLTHYCVAMNQPRMRATRISPDAREITFEFIDSTNLPSRNQGHMDKAVYRFFDDGTFTTRWTWFQDGQEKWMEEIRCRRVN